MKINKTYFNNFETLNYLVIKQLLLIQSEINLIISLV